MKDPNTDGQQSVKNIALFTRFAEPGFIEQSLHALQAKEQVVVFTENVEMLSAIKALLSNVVGVGNLDVSEPSANSIKHAFQAVLQAHSPSLIVVIDMAWVHDVLYSGAFFENWSALAEELTVTLGCSFVSVYNLDVLVEHQMQAALSAHRLFLAPSGIHSNPFWLPTQLSEHGATDEQVAFLLGAAVPDYTGLQCLNQTNRSLAQGANHGWLTGANQIRLAQPVTERWHIRCLGPLRVYRGGQHKIDWQIKGGSPNKTRTLFAYLLNAGEKGAHADRIGELLWPDSGTEQVKRSRLHYAVAMLRKTLGSSDTVLRSSEFYRLNIPAGSWTDISRFEQTCRRGLALSKQGHFTEALRVYRQSEQLYSGDLFEDIPVQYVHSEFEDWCLPRRRWLKEMVIKLFRDMSVVLRTLEKPDEALSLCLKALALDPASETANSEAMHVFHAQDRYDAISRQYKQYLSAVHTIGGAPSGAGIHQLHDRLQSGAITYAAPESI